MASAEEDLECGLCLNIYKSPKFLPCFHTFCEGCVEDLVKNTGNRPLKCPKCRQQFKLPPGGVSKLQTNFYLTPLLNHKRCMLHRTETLKLYCTVCNKLFHPIPLQQSVAIRQVFRCCEDTQLYVHAVCVDSCFNTVFVAYGASGTGGEGREVRRHRQNGELMLKSSETIRGRVCLGGLNGGWVRVEGKEFPAKDWFLEDFNPDGNKSATRKYDVYNKGDARFVLRVHESGLCDLRSVTITDYTDTTDVKVCEVSAKTPIAMDVSKDGRLVAVLEEGRDHVMLYRHDNSEPHLIYRGQAEAFRPLDVCFYFIGEDERLVIADWLNDVLHVVKVGENCKLIGHVGVECPELVKPTALCADSKGCLWIGCQGGRVLALSQQ